MKRTNGLWLRALREKASISLRDMAAYLQLSAGYVSDLERNLRNVTDQVEEGYENRLKVAHAAGTDRR